MFEILIVDDEKSVVQSLALTIPWSEYGISQVHQALSGKEALKIITGETIHIAIVDIRMPGMDGLHLIDQINAISSKTKCIILTGFAEFDYARQALEKRTVRYFLKPVDINQLINCVQEIVISIQKEWEQIASYERAFTIVKENLPIMRSELLKRIIEGYDIHLQTLAKKLVMLDLPYREGDEVYLLLLRMEEDYNIYDPTSVSLLEYAIENIAQETVGEHFNIWKSKDDYENIVFLLKPIDSEQAELFQSITTIQHLVEQRAADLQINIHTYLKGTVSLLVSRSCRFPEEVESVYRTSSSRLNRQLASENGLFLTLSDSLPSHKISSLDILYRPPQLLHLLEAGKNEAAQIKLQAVFDEMMAKDEKSQEHVVELFCHLYSAFSCLIHKRGHAANDYLSNVSDNFIKKYPLYSISSLQEWTLEQLNKLGQADQDEANNLKSQVISKVNFLIETQIENISVQYIADYVHLHPVYVSKLFKEEMGVTLSEYLHKVKMGQAAHLLVQTNKKIYEICNKLGYQNVPHFIKLFKSGYGMTPQEYRNRNK